MARLIYSALSSLDGYVADQDGKFDWAAPDEELHTFVNDLSRPVGTYLLGRRMYEVLSYWEGIDLTDQPPYVRDFAEIWRAAEKVVFSKTLTTVSTGKTRLEREFAAETVLQLKATSAEDLAVAGPTLAAHAFEAELVDECQLFLAPVSVGGGTKSLPDDVRLTLELLDQRRFGSGTVYLRYRVGSRQG